MGINYGRFPLLWVMQDLYHQPYYSLEYYIVNDRYHEMEWRVGKCLLYQIALQQGQLRLAQANILASDCSLSEAISRFFQESRAPKP